ncbi:uncharacterized protein LOC133332272 [Musca vetustissima]|uniref:uncharacterized protein LOC133332272 n=1 Tax=Musca vetustissima TaxID=27455 RepID=UPI002AB707CD|nr:uncharacterized protein LOC133332272 [Musca vetustissima]
MSSIKYLLAIAVIATLATTAFAVHCYQCDSLTNKKCGEQFEAEESMKVDCGKAAAPAYLLSWITGTNLNATGCMKQTVDAKVGGIHIVRTCYFGDISQTDKGCKLNPTDLLSSQLSCDVCAGELCNGSTSMMPVLMTIVVFFGLARLFS